MAKGWNQFWTYGITDELARKLKPSGVYTLIGLGTFITLTLFLIIVFLIWKSKRPNRVGRVQRRADEVDVEAGIPNPPPAYGAEADIGAVVLAAGDLEVPGLPAYEEEAPVGEINIAVIEGDEILVIRVEEEEEVDLGDRLQRPPSYRENWNPWMEQDEAPGRVIT